MTEIVSTPGRLQREIDALQDRLVELESEVDQCRRSEAKLRLAAESLPIAIAMIDQEGRIVLVNGQTEKLFGYPRCELLGQPVEALVPERFRDSHPGYRASFFAEPEIRSMGAGRDLFGQRKDGSEFPVEIGLTPIETEEGCFVVSAIVDITERKRVEERARQLARSVETSRVQTLNQSEKEIEELEQQAAQLARSVETSRIQTLDQSNKEVHKLNEDLEQRVMNRTAELEAANKELEAFSYSVSHDLRAPLRAIDGFSRILLQEYAAAMPTEAREYLQDVRANTQQMGHLVDDLLAFSRFGRKPVNKQRVEPAGLVRQCLDELRDQQAGRRVEVLVGELADCWGDVALLKQVWTNLLSNALKYTTRREVAIIEIGGHSGDSRGEQAYFVKDNGVGFDMRHAQKLFGVFQRLHRAEEYEGTGVGLAIVERIIHRHGGRVWAEARPDEGATFHFTLPENGRVP